MAELKAELLELLRGDPALRAQLRDALGLVVDAAAVLERIERNTEAIHELRADLQREVIALRRDMQREITALRADFQREITSLRADFQRETERLWEAIAGLREDFQRETRALHRTLSAIGARWGYLSEQALREGMEGVLQELFPGAVAIRRWRVHDAQGEVLGYPCWVEIDLVVTADGRTVLVELNSSVSAGDILRLRRVASFYQAREGQRPSAVAVVSPFVDPRAEQAASLAGIEIYTSTRAA
ncbi:MAG: hypothetical protein KatS3mg102_1450 [Planctomycetota bacterium]|nr:MAG: hypothetical protein KatS3mg102_1450 [Planctomycetota bacterium]